MHLVRENSSACVDERTLSKRSTVRSQRSFAVAVVCDDAASSIERATSSKQQATRSTTFDSCYTWGPSSSHMSGVRSGTLRYTVYSHLTLHTSYAPVYQLTSMASRCEAALRPIMFKFYVSPGTRRHWLTVASNHTFLFQNL